jgi:putative ABC transport system permease protein
MGRGSSTNGLLPEGKMPSVENIVDARLGLVTSGYFQALGIPILRGRTFKSEDRQGGQKVMIVSETLAAALFPGEDPIGRRVACCEAGPDGSPDFKVIVGVVGGTRSRGLGQEIYPEFYLPMAQAPPEVWNWFQRSMYIVARTHGKPEAVMQPLRRAIAAFDPDVPLYDVLSMEQRMADSLAPARFNTLLLTMLGAFGLLLAAGGIYGVAAYFVTQRTAEIGVRMALGATQRDVLRLVLWRAILPVAIGVSLGLAASVAATRVLAASLVGVEPTDPLTFAAVILVLVATALLASLFPARRAASVDPTQALQAV